ncbi:enoyl-CoA hydratase/isomerase family protein [Nocardioides humilatus]|uniref:Enoyl-CoA hydratase/isomerase family protein n=1 Tax=Nocardioides humilatus TaxID=2607660 RepID=A0A5B1LC21_9ACTN|nr:enoyl-CoA hydratase/isomerase family protein [Nocardioides humilatus]
MTGVRYHAADGIGRITLARPEASNAVDLPTASSLGEAVRAAVADPDVRVILIDAEGPRFCAGGDVAAMAAADDKPAAVRELATTFDAALRELDAAEKPVVAVVRGAVAGAGLGIILACDLVVAAQSTKLLTAYTSVGITPDCGVSWLLPRAVGQQRALELVLTGRPLSADDAQAWGLVTTVVEDAALETAAEEVASRLAALSPFAAGQARRLIRSSWSATKAQSSEDEIRTVTEAISRVFS